MKFIRFVYNVVVILACLQVSLLHGAKILGFFATISRSHFIVEEPVMRGLAKRGHENYLNNNTAFERFKAGTTNENRSNFIELMKLTGPFTGISMDMLNHPKFQSIKNESFDLLIVGWYFNEYVLGLSGHFQCPSVVITPSINFYPTKRLSGNPNSVSTLPTAFAHFETPMTFFQRLQNFIIHLAEFVAMEFVVYYYMKPLYLEAFKPDKYPSFEEVQKNVSLILVTQHFSSGRAEALLPGVIEVEGIHVKKKSSPLPKDIEDFLGSATDGAIYFSLGSSTKSCDMSPEKITVLLNKFRSIKLKVLWKFESDLPNLPENVLIGKWLPQDDILAHLKIRLFISHCGKGGITEAKYHGVPILAIPLFADQFSYADHIINEGWAVKLPITDLNEERFSKTLDEVLHNPKYKLTARKLSNLSKDRPEHPLDKAAFWIEYVIRHNGAKHMQSSAVHLNLLQYYMIDVIVFILVCVYATVKFLQTLLKLFLRKVFSVAKKQIKNE